MLRFLSFLFNKPYETCKSCETLKEQLAFERAEKKELTQTLLNIINPKVIEQPAVEINPIPISTGSWRKRRAILEEQDRETAKTLQSSKFVGKPDSEISKLEDELGIGEEKNG